MLEKGGRGIQRGYYVTLQYNSTMSILDKKAGNLYLTRVLCHSIILIKNHVTRMTAVCSQLCPLKYKRQISLSSNRNKFEIRKKRKRHDNDKEG
jgi:uncharacterized membrane-anchored protein